MKITHLFITIFFFSISGLQAQSIIPKDKRIDEYVKIQMQETGTVGMAVAILKDGKLLHKNTYGIANLEYSIPVHSNTNFTIASATKLMTSTLIMKLLQDKKISLEDSVDKYLPNATNWKNVKIKHLLAHEGGIEWPSSLGGYLGIGSSANFKVESIDDLILKLSKSQLLYTPGTKQTYQNGDYFVLQYIIEKLYGRPLEDILEIELMQYFGMKDGGFDREIRSFPYLTMKPIYNKSQNFTKGTKGSTIFKGFYAPSSYAAGGLFLSLDDFIQWAKVLDNGKIINTSIQKQAYLPTEVVDGGFSQMGWTLKKNKGVTITGHSGGPGLADVLRVPDDNFTVVVLTNNADLNAYMAEEILKMYYPQLEIEKIPKTFDRKLGYN